MSGSLHITIYLDGTRNNKDNDGPQGTHTNVARLYDIDTARGTNLARNSSHAPVQYDWQACDGLAEKVYLDGVGSQRRNKPASAFECATGAGGRSRIEQAYAVLVAFHNKYPDRTVDVNLVGFSRGAAQARALSNVFIERGVPKLDSQRRPTGDYLVQPGQATVNKLAIFDTVASYGNPLTDFHLNKNLEIHRNVASTTHLIAMNEYRATFPLTSALRSDDNTRIEEIKFAGAHSQVGGGYRNDVLAAGPLALMHQRLQAAGVALGPLLPADALRVEQYNALISDPVRLQQALIDSRLSEGNEAFELDDEGVYKAVDNSPFALERGTFRRWDKQKHPFDHDVSGRKVIYENDQSLSKPLTHIRNEALARWARSGQDGPLVEPVGVAKSEETLKRGADFESKLAALDASCQAQVEQLSELLTRSRPDVAYLQQLGLAAVPVSCAARYAVVRINPEGSAAFTDLGFEYELGRILEDAADGARATAPLKMDQALPLHDTNGNVVGSLQAMHEVPPREDQGVMIALDMQGVSIGAQADFLHDGFQQAAAWVAQQEPGLHSNTWIIPGRDGQPVGQAYIEKAPERDVQPIVAWEGPQP